MTLSGAAGGLRVEGKGVRKEEEEDINVLLIFLLKFTLYSPTSLFQSFFAIFFQNKFLISFFDD